MNPGFVLVTGAGGFVGRQLCPQLVRAGWRVRATWVHAQPPTAMVGENIEWHRISALGPSTDWAPVLADGITAVVHLAALAHRVGPREQVPDSAYDIANHLGTARLIEQVSKVPSVRRLVFVSSIGAVTSLAEEQLDENSACRPDTAYGRSKLAAEHAVQHGLAGSKVEWCILRPPLLYGPGNPGNMARLLRLLKLRLPLPFASIHNRRSFLYVGNFVNALVTSLTHPMAANRVFCVSDDADLSTPELMLRLSHLSGRPARLWPFPVAGLRLLGILGDILARATGRPLAFDSGTINKFCGSLSVNGDIFRSACDWRPPFSVDEGLRATVALPDASARRMLSS